MKSFGLEDFMMNMSLSVNVTNNTASPTSSDTIGSDDATWILTSAFIIFTMQSGFGLLESGLVSRKNEANIMVKNAVDVIYGGLSYWLFGFALSFGKEGRNYRFCGLGYFLTDADELQMGGVFAKYFFQLSFSTTATTIVSGAMAERANLKAYTLFSFVNTITYCFPAHWIWDDEGWLRKLGAVDIAGGGAVHLVGGISGLVATLMLKPRTGRFDPRVPAKQLASPTNVLLGTFMLWWGWLGFNCGSTFGISGAKWKLASRSAVVTINGSIGGGIMGMFYSYTFYKGKLNIPVFVTGILGGLVSITAICSIARPWEALVISSIGALIACSGCQLLERLKIDDPVGCVPTHAFAGMWGLVAVGLFAEKSGTLEKGFSHSAGVFKGGSWSFLGIQLLTILSVAAWSSTTTFLELTLINKVLPLRVSMEDEIIGADQTEHGIFNDLSFLYDFSEHPASIHESMAGKEEEEQEEQEEDLEHSLENQNNSVSKELEKATHKSSKTYFSQLKLRRQTVECWRRKSFDPSTDLSQGITSISSQSTGTFTVVKTCFDNESFQHEEVNKDKGTSGNERKDDHSSGKDSSDLEVATNETKA